MNVNIQFKKGALELCVLYLIHKQDQYGYELAQQVSSYIEVAEGALYPLLRRLVKEGYCSTYLKESNEGPPRKYFKITNKGDEYLTVLLKEWENFVSGVTRLIEGGE
ncbi:PadR family transcriptional regulator [Bacillus horti]|uniref:PadR family transcriptional regulator PadR n=1 Tax=Caldalkalibacillus horti TaxID=77523 RepID=A0ABT9W0A3_9BACI|nr:PadR family transcriptional regulator [Bacillus horti]MDQ0166664.1 PadR family transcriptional regulator PadR [Bacillus horti]